MKRIEHDPNAKLDYGWDWTSWLQVGETIQTYTVTSDIAGAVISNVQLTGNVVSAMIASATSSGTLTNHVVSSLGREDDRSWFLDVKQR